MVYLKGLLTSVSCDLGTSVSGLYLHFLHVRNNIIWEMATHSSTLAWKIP